MPFGYVIFHIYSVKSGHYMNFVNTKHSCTFSIELHMLIPTASWTPNKQS